MLTYQPVIGLEIHVELATKSKMFCGCKNDPFFAREPNCYTCPVCLGMPGGLPVPNKKAIKWTVMLGLALDCEIPPMAKFDRKNYFYPDLAKGYQISQYDQPFAINGQLKLKMRNEKLKIEEEKIVRIRRVHLEEDTGKLLHATIEGKKCTLIDFNRSGVPLVEIVTEPDIRSAEEAKIFLKKLHQIIRYLDISDADMEKGSMRLEPNISVRVSTVSRKSVKLTKSRPGLVPNYKVEIKNINSFRFAERAINYEIDRQIGLLEKGETPVQETRSWNEAKAITIPRRRKEEAHDYRYFPEPDIPPMCVAQNLIRQLTDQIPELPDAKKERFMKDYGLSEYDASLLTETRPLADYFEKAVKVSATVREGEITAKKIANWIINKKPGVEEILPSQLVAQIKQASQVTTVSADKLEKVIKQVIEENTQAVNDYRSGKEQALMFLVGKSKAILTQVDTGKLVAVLKKLLI